MQSAPIITNPYVTHATPTVELQLLLLAAIVCFTLGVFLAEQTAMRRIWRALDVLSSRTSTTALGAVETA